MKNERIICAHSKNIVRNVIRFCCILCLMCSSSYNLRAEGSDDEAKAGPKPVSIHLETIEHDSVKQVCATVMLESGGPAVGAELKFFVKRHFGMLPIGAEVNNTDEQGKATVDFPIDLPADSAGNVTIIASIENSDHFEDASEQTVAHWGVPTELSPKMTERALWAARANAPMLLIIAINAMIAAVWLTILYIIFQLFKIKRIGKV